jgi:hypothetical protein
MTIFLLLLFANKSKQQHGKNENKNTGLFINCMDFVSNRHFFCYAWALGYAYGKAIEEKKTFRALLVFELI